MSDVSRITDLVSKHLKEHQDQGSLDILQRHLIHQMAHLKQQFQAPINAAASQIITSYLQYLEHENKKMVKARELFLTSLGVLRALAEVSGETEAVDRIDKVRKGLGVEIP